MSTLLQISINDKYQYNMFIKGGSINQCRTRRAGNTTTTLPVTSRYRFALGPLVNYHKAKYQYFKWMVMHSSLNTGYNVML